MLPRTISVFQFPLPWLSVGKTMKDCANSPSHVIYLIKNMYLIKNILAGNFQLNRKRFWLVICTFTTVQSLWMTVLDSCAHIRDQPCVHLYWHTCVQVYTYCCLHPRKCTQEIIYNTLIRLAVLEACQISILFSEHQLFFFYSKFSTKPIRG